jgi:hypothetical protein
MKEQAAAGGVDADVDHLFDIPVVLVQTFIGYKHDARSTAFEAGGFEVLESEAPAGKRSLLGRLFGKA